MRVFNRSKNPKKPNWWLTYYVDRQRVREPGKGTKQASEEYAREIVRQIDAGTWTHPNERPGGKDSFRNYARTVIERRVLRGVVTADKDERGHVDNHLEPVFGEMALRDITFKRLKDGFAIIAAKDLGGRTIRNIHSTMRAILIEAAEDELIPFAPTPLTARRDHLPPPVDRDPEWRESAVFVGDDVRTIAACVEIPIARRVFYLTAAMTGARSFSELALVHVRDYARAMEPLASIAFEAAKTGRHKGRQRRYVPVHPELAVLLDWWLATEYEITHGYAPTPDRLLFPTTSARRRRSGLQVTSQQELWGHWKKHDLPAAGLTHRRIHDLRRTLTSELRAAGVQGDQVAAVTHRSTGHRMQDQYTSWQWAALCAEVVRVNWSIPFPLPDKPARDFGHTPEATTTPVVE